MRWLTLAGLCLAAYAASVAGAQAAPAGARRGQGGGAGAPAAAAQRPQAAPAASMTLNDDKTVTWSYRAPEASSMAIHLQISPGQMDIELEKSENGVWTGTTPEPLEPGFYFYYLVVDGLEVLDPAAQEYRGRGTRWGSILTVPGDTPQDFEMRDDIPHGIITHALIQSEVMGGQRGITVYLPNSYLTSTESYPVLYLMHGGGGDEDTWIKTGAIDRLLDSWIAGGRINELVVVMSSQGGLPSVSPGVPDPLHDYYTREIMPYVEARYRVKTGPENTAVAGFSLGCAHAVSLGLGLGGRFGGAAFLSGAFGSRDGQPDKLVEGYPVLQDAEKANALFSALYIAVGEQESEMSIAAAKSVSEELAKAGINHRFMTGPGVHLMKTDWNALEAFLHDFTGAK